MVRTSVSIPKELKPALKSLERYAEDNGVENCSTSLVLTTLIAMHDSKRHGSAFLLECKRQRGLDARTKEGKKAGIRSPGAAKPARPKGKPTKKAKKTKRTTSDDLDRFLG
jgi:hypothetical protein